MSLSIVLPCYNEEDNIKRIPSELMPVLEALNIEYEILLIDDGSTDRTVDVARSLNIPQMRIIQHGKNEGLGEAIKTAFRSAKSDMLITLDADFTFHPNLIPRLLKRFRVGDVDIVIGSPNLAGNYEAIPFYRLFISRCANIIYKFLFGKEITAISQMLRLYKTEDVKKLKIDARGFDVFAEIIFKMIVIDGKKFAEVEAPFTVRKFGVSKLNYKKEMLRHLRLLSKIISWRVKNIFT